MNKMIAYCGIDCSRCDAYLATTNNDQALPDNPTIIFFRKNYLTKNWGEEVK